MEQLGDKRLLQTLEKLEQEAKRFTKRMKTQETDDGKMRIDELHKKVNELERMKRDLQRQASITTMAGKIITNGNGARDSRMDTPVCNGLPTREELRHSNEERKYEAFLQAFRLTGVSLVKCDSGILLIELLTSHEGRFYEAYYIEITDIGEDNKTLSHHTIPYFIPVMSYFDSYLAGKLHFHGFLLPIIKELNGFVSRRQQALRVESVHKKYLKENVATMSYDLIQLVTNEFDVVELKVKFWYVVRLLYDNQSAIRPTKVRCRVQFAEKSQEIDIIKDIKMCYKNYEITEAFTKVIEIACETSQISTSTSHTTSSSSNDSTKVNNSSKVNDSSKINDSSKVNDSKINNTQ